MTVSEYATIRREGDTFPADAYLPERAFTALRSLAVGGDAPVSAGWQGGREWLRLKNWVGLLPLGNVVLEVLPKTHATLPEGRRALLAMLRQWPRAPFKQLPPATLHTARWPLWETFAGAFLDVAFARLASGLPKQYETLRSQEPVLRGKLRVADHLRQAVTRPDRFAVTYQTRTANTPANRLLKSTARYVLTQTTHHQPRARQLLFALDDVAFSQNIAEDSRCARDHNRLTAVDGTLLDWAEILLAGQAPAPGSGALAVPYSLLFPAERLFEHYVAVGVRRGGWPGSVEVQESQTHLVHEHAGKPQFQLRPDIVWRTADRTVVLDTKWKLLDASKPNYGLEQSDLYQLYAYGKKYGATDVALVYPATATFREPLAPFGYDATLRLHVLPFALARPIGEETARLLSRLTT